ARRRFAVLANGSLQLGAGKVVEADGFCLDLSRLHDGSRVANALYCVDGGGEGVEGEGGDVFYTALLAVGELFLLLTLCAYAFVPEVGRKPHARALMCHCGAMLAAFATLVPLQLGALPLGGGACYAAVLLVQFGMLASFFWLNVLCIDIAWSFRFVKDTGLLFVQKVSPAVMENYFSDDDLLKYNVMSDVHGSGVGGESEREVKLEELVTRTEFKTFTEIGNRKSVANA
ncbi:uncharacterized protein GBIM_05653, partial [Gryllus bimaculatus]